VEQSGGGGLGWLVGGGRGGRSLQEEAGLLPSVPKRRAGAWRLWTGILILFLVLFSSTFNFMIISLDTKRGRECLIRKGKRAGDKIRQIRPSYTHHGGGSALFGVPFRTRLFFFSFFILSSSPINLSIGDW
jgi:hypothetical protein